jgi:hypothetical protein
MGLFDAFQGGASIPGIYAPWMTYGQGGPQIDPSQAMSPAGPLDTSSPQPSMPSQGGGGFGGAMSGLFAGLNRQSPSDGLSPLDQIGRLGATFQDAGQPGSQGANLAATDTALNMPLARQMNQINMQAARQKQAMLQQAFGMMNAAPAEQAPQVGSPSPQQPIPAQGNPMMPQVGASPQAPGGAPQVAPFQQSVPSLPGVRPSPLTPQMRKALGIMALVDGHPDQAATIMDDRKKITAGPDGWMYDQDTGEVIGRLPNHANVNGFNVDQGSPGNDGKFFPKIADGATPLYDRQGNVVAQRLLDGTTQAVQAQAAATAAGTASQDLIPVNLPDGSTVQMPRDAAVALTRAKVLGAGAIPAGLGQSQSPADKVTAEGTAKTNVERTAAQPQQFAGLQDQGRATDLAIQTINDVLGQSIGPDGKRVQSRPSMVNGWNSGFAANLGGVKGTGAYNLEQKLSPLKAIIGFGELQKMRANSPTGGALGQVSERENQLLQSLYGSMDPGQDPQQFVKSLQDIRDQLLKTKAQREQLYAQQYGPAASSAQSSPAKPAMSGKGYRIVGVR